MFINLGPQMADISVDNQRANLNTVPYGTPPPPLKIQVSKIGARHVSSWSKLGLEPKYHDPGTFGGSGQRGQTYRQTDKIREYIESSHFPLPVCSARTAVKGNRESKDLCKVHPYHQFCLYFSCVIFVFYFSN